MYRSGYFEDIKNASQAMMKILYGQEIGLSPMEAINGLYLQKGRLCAFADLLGDKIKASGKYDYKVRTLTDDICVIDWFVDSELVGHSEFRYEQAVKAGLTSKQTWQAYRQNLLFARALSFGYKLYARGCFRITLQTFEEMKDEGALVLEDKATQAIAKGGKKLPASLKTSGQIAEELTAPTLGSAPPPKPSMEVGPDNPPTTPGQMSELIEAGKAKGWSPSAISQWTCEKFNLAPDKTFPEKFSFNMWEAAMRFVKNNQPPKKEVARV